MPFVARLVEVDYGTRVVGGSTNEILDGDVKIKEDLQYGRGSVSFSFWAFATTDAAFIALTQGLEADFATIRQRLTIKLNGVVWRDWNPDPTVNTGFHQTPTIRKVGDGADTVRSRRYEVTIDFQTPATLAGQAGRLDSTVNLETEPGGRRRITISGIYRALGTNDARAQYLASIGAYETSVCNGLIGAGKWELVHRPREEADDITKNLSFTRVYREILLQQNSAVLDDPNVVDQELTITRARFAPGDTQLVTRAARLQEFRVAYRAWVLAGAGDLAAYWDSTLRPWVVQHALAVTGAGVAAITAEDPTFDYNNRVVSASMSILSPNGSDLLQATVTTIDEADPGITFAPVWSGDVYAKHVFQGPATLTRTITTVVRRLLTAATALATLKGNVADVGAVASSQSALGLDSVGSFAGGPSLSITFPSAAGGGAKATPATLVPSPTPPVGGSRTGFVPLGPQVTTLTPLTLGLADRSFDVLDSQTVLRLSYRRSP